MAEEKFILASLEEPESKELAQVIASNTARKILDLLSKEDLSETDISNKLNIPLTTVHYNIQQLLNAKLIETKEFKWSDKGKKVHYYKISNKLIIIAPKSQNNFLEKIRTIIPVALIGLVATIFIHFFTKINSIGDSMLTKTQFSGVAEATTTTGNLVAQQPNYALWFFSGLVTAIVLYLIIAYWKSRK